MFLLKFQHGHCRHREGEVVAREFAEGVESTAIPG